MVTMSELQGWFAGRMHDDWFTCAPEVLADRDEILVTGTLPTPKTDGDETAVASACRSRISGFREDTRDARIKVATEAEHRFGCKVSWAARCGDEELRFTTASVPVMTRLRIDERRVLDTLIDAGIARSRSDALAWCVKLVGAKQADWIDELRDALTAVEKVRAEGPNLD